MKISRVYPGPAIASGIINNILNKEYRYSEGSEMKPVDTE